MNRLPDRTGLLIGPICALIVTGLSAAMLVHGLFLEKRRTPNVLDDMLRAAAASLGTTGVALLSVALVAPALVWFARDLRRYRAIRADDRRRYGANRE